jgi:hypothetical protein
LPLLITLPAIPSLFNFSGSHYIRRQPLEEIIISSLFAFTTLTKLNQNNQTHRIDHSLSNSFLKQAGCRQRIHNACHIIIKLSYPKKETSVAHNNFFADASFAVVCLYFFFVKNMILKQKKLLQITRTKFTDH